MAFPLLLSKRPKLSGISSPADLNSVVAWYDFTDLSYLWQNVARTVPVTSDGQVIGSVDERIAGVAHGLQSTTSLKPTWSDGIRSGYGAAQFDRIDDFLEDTVNNYSRPMQLFAFAQTLRNGSNSHYLYGNPTDNRGDVRHAGTGNTLVMESNGSVGSSSLGMAQLQQKTHFLEFLWWEDNSQDSRIYEANVLIGNGTNMVFYEDFAGISIGRDGAQAANSWAEYIFEIVIVTPSSSDYEWEGYESNRTLLGDYWLSKYGTLAELV